MTTKKLALRKTIDVDIDAIRVHESNPNRMSEWDFSQLKKSIKEDGFDEPIKIVVDPAYEEGEGYICVSGEHRLRAAEELGYSTIPAIIENTWDVTRADAELVRRNLHRGKFDSKKMRQLLNDRFGDFTREEQAAMLGFENSSEMQKLAKLRDEQTFSDEEADRIENQLNESEIEMEMVDGLHGMVASVFGEYGTDVDLSFIAFMLNRKIQLLLRMDTTTAKLVERLVNLCQREEMDINEALQNALEPYLDEAGAPEVDDSEE